MKDLWLLIGLVPLLAHADGTRMAPPARWYTHSEVQRGRDVYRGHCAGCHGDHAEGSGAWNDHASLPPPLNGSGHVAHHSLDQLLGKIELGGLMGNGRMPPFREVLTAPERRAALAYVQSLWPDEVYRNWEAGPGVIKH